MECTVSCVYKLNGAPYGTTDALQVHVSHGCQQYGSQDVHSKFHVIFDWLFLIRETCHLGKERNRKPMIFVVLPGVNSRSYVMFLESCSKRAISFKLSTACKALFSTLFISK